MYDALLSAPAGGLDEDVWPWPCAGMLAPDADGPATAGPRAGMEWRGEANVRGAAGLSAAYGFSEADDGPAPVSPLLLEEA